MHLLPMTAASSTKSSLTPHEHQSMPAIVPPHLLSLGFDWSYVDAGCIEAVPAAKTSFPTTRCTRKSPTPNFHTSLHFTRPVDHPLHPMARQTHHDRLPHLLKKGNLERIASNNSWPTEDSVCVSSLGIGGWDEEDENDAVDEHADHHNELQGISLPAQTWTVIVEAETCHAGDTPWFKLVKKDAGVLWLEGDEVLVFLESLESSTRNICILLLDDDVSAIVPLAEANEFFATMLCVPAGVSHIVAPVSSPRSDSFLLRRFLCAHDPLSALRFADYADGRIHSHLTC